MLKYNKKENYELYDLVMNNFIFFYHLKTKQKVRFFSLKNFDHKFTLKKNNFSITRSISYPVGTLAKDGIVLNIVDYTKNVYSIFNFKEIKLDFVSKIEKPFINTDIIKPDFNKNIFFIHISKALNKIEIKINNDVIVFQFLNLKDLSIKINSLFFYCFNLNKEFNCEINDFNSKHLKIRDIIEYV